MWFRNLQLYRLTQPFELSPEELHERLEARRSRPCGPLEPATLGWAPPLGREGTLLTHAVGRCIMVCARREERLLPASVVREEVGERVEQLETASGRKLGRREKSELKDNVVLELLPQAFVRSAHLHAYIDAANGWLIVDSPTPKRAEELIDLLRETLGSLPLQPLEVERSPAGVMTQWLHSGRLPGDLLPGDECELRDPTEEGSVVRCRHLDLGGEEIRVHLDAGRQVVRLALEWQDHIAFVLCDDLSLKRLKFLDLIQEQAAEVEAEDAATRFDVDFALMSGELGRLLPRLFGLFGGVAEKGAGTADPSPESQ